MKKFIRKDDEAVSPVIAVILMVAITVVLAGVLYVWVSGFGGGGTTGISVSANKSDKNVYYSVEIVKVSGGTLNIADAKFIIVTNTGTQLLERSYTDASPTKVEDVDTTVYPISSSTQVVLNGTSGPPTDASAPLTWEYCYFAILDSETDGKINSGDAIWVYKDYDDDGDDEITSGYRIKILDADGNEVLNKEL
jgi:flagellin-like protein